MNLTIDVNIIRDAINTGLPFGGYDAPELVVQRPGSSAALRATIAEGGARPLRQRKADNWRQEDDCGCGCRE